MGRVILKMQDGHFESYRCKSKERAAQIAGKRPNSTKWEYYDDNVCIPPPRKKQKIENAPLTLEELEAIMKQGGLI